MSARELSPFELSPASSEPSAAPSSTLPNAFARMRATEGASKLLSGKRDGCTRPAPEYNDNYDPYKPQPPTLPPDYSPYNPGEPLYNDRNIKVTNLPNGHTVAGASKKPRTSWLWKIGYALNDNTKKGKPLIWCCKLCKYIYIIIS